MISGIGNPDYLMVQTNSKLHQSGPRPAAEAYAKLDADGSNSLDENELSAMIDRMKQHVPGMGDIDAATALAKLDSDGNGGLSLEEFEAGRDQAFGEISSRLRSAGFGSGGFGVGGIGGSGDLQQMLLDAFDSSLNEDEKEKGVLI